jgi:large subunit ribosomal protein L28
MFPSLAWFSEVVSQPFKRSQYGLFHGKMKQYGNNVPFSKHKTRRTWLPNVQSKRLISESLGKELKLKVTTRALRTIKKVRFREYYLLNSLMIIFIAWRSRPVSPEDKCRQAGLRGHEAALDG